jgi:hypothetical protein
MASNKLPKKLYKYFWDVEPEKIDLKKNGPYVLERILDWGDTKDVRWLKRVYGRDLIADAVRRRRGLSRKSAVFWTDLLDINQQEVMCLQKPYRGRPFGP